MCYFVFFTSVKYVFWFFFFFQAEDGIRDLYVTGVSDVCSSDLAETWGAMAASVWNTLTLSLSTREGSTARMLAGNGVPRIIGISPPSSPGSRIPITRSTPLTSFVSSVFPSTTTARNRPSPSWATYSPGVRWMSSTEPTRYSSSFSASVEKSGIVASSATVITMPSHPLPPSVPAAQATQVTITARDYCAGSSIGKTRERARTFVLRLVEMTTVIRKEASGRPDLTAEVSDAVARGAQTYPLSARRRVCNGRSWRQRLGVWTLMLQSCLRRGPPGGCRFSSCLSPGTSLTWPAACCLIDL